MMIGASRTDARSFGDQVSDVTGPTPACSLHTSSDSHAFCTGALVWGGSRVVTAGHCFNSNPREVFVRCPAMTGAPKKISFELRSGYKKEGESGKDYPFSDFASAAVDYSSESLPPVASAGKIENLASGDQCEVQGLGFNDQGQRLRRFPINLSEMPDHQSVKQQIAATGGKPYCKEPFIVERPQKGTCSQEMAGRLRQALDLVCSNPDGKSVIHEIAKVIGVKSAIFTGGDSGGPLMCRKSGESDFSIIGLNSTIIIPDADLFAPQANPANPGKNLYVPKCEGGKLSNPSAQIQQCLKSGSGSVTLYFGLAFTSPAARCDADSTSAPRVAPRSNHSAPASSAQE